MNMLSVLQKSFLKPACPLALTPTSAALIHKTLTREYPAILYGGRLDVDVFKDQLAQDGPILSKLDGKIPYRDGNGLSRTVFTATNIII